MFQNKIKILVVDDSPFYRRLLVSVIRKSDRYEAMDPASNGEEAVQVVLRQRPDLILLDLQMPYMDGFTFLRWLMMNSPIPVIVVSSKSDVSSTFKALELGAADFLEKPASEKESSDLERDLLKRVDVIARIPVRKLIARTELFRDTRAELAAPLDIPVPTSPTKTTSRKQVRAVMIGASTGGPTAIFSIITSLPKDFSVPLSIAQHMPSGFTKSFAERLNKMSKLEVYEAQGGEPVVPGRVYIAPGGYHLFFESKGDMVFTKLREKVEENRYVPSVDTLMESAVSVFQGKVLGVLLTGMGNDGLQGMRRIKSSGGVTLAESEETAVVFGMPREAITAGVVDKVVSLPHISSQITKLCT